MHLWQEYHRRDIMTSLHHIQWHVLSPGLITDDINVATCRGFSTIRSPFPSLGVIRTLWGDHLLLYRYSNLHIFIQPAYYSFIYLCQHGFMGSYFIHWVIPHCYHYLHGAQTVPDLSSGVEGVTLASCELLICCCHSWFTFFAFLAQKDNPDIFSTFCVMDLESAISPRSFSSLWYWIGTKKPRSRHYCYWVF